MKPSLLLLPAMAFFSTSLSSTATIIVSDSFLVGGAPNYNSGNLSNQTGTGGTVGYITGGSWLNNTGAVNFLGTGTGLTHPLVTNPASGVNDSTVSTPGVNQIRSQVRNIGTYTTTGADYYMSGLLSSSVSFTTGTSVMGISSGVSTGALPSNGLQIGFTGGGNISVFYKNGAGTYTSTVLLSSYTVSSAYMFVFHLGGSGTTLDASIYDQAGTLVNTLTGLTTLTSVANDLKQVDFATSADFNTGSPSVVKFDEFRFGTALSDVLIPEPSAFLLSGAGVLGLGLRRRRPSRL